VCVCVCVCVCACVTGESESMIGEVLSGPLKDRRKEVVIVTKVGYLQVKHAREHILLQNARLKETHFMATVFVATISSVCIFAKQFPQIDRYNIPTEVVFFCTNYCRDSRLLHAVCETV